MPRETKEQRRARERREQEAFYGFVTPPEMLKPLRDLVAKVDEIMASPAWTRARPEQQIFIEHFRMDVENTERTVVLSYRLLVERMEWVSAKLQIGLRSWMRANQQPTPAALTEPMKEA